jgi:hypothetical protein
VIIVAQKKRVRSKGRYVWHLHAEGSVGSLYWNDPIEAGPDRTLFCDAARHDKTHPIRIRRDDPDLLAHLVYTKSRHPPRWAKRSHA